MCVYGLSDAVPLLDAPTSNSSTDYYEILCFFDVMKMMKCDEYLASPVIELFVISV